MEIQKCMGKDWNNNWFNCLEYLGNLYDFVDCL
jgi:hypothetical protein